MSSQGHTQFYSRRDEFSSFNLKYLLLSFTVTSTEILIVIVSTITNQQSMLPQHTNLFEYIPDDHIVVKHLTRVYKSLTTGHLE